MKIVKWGLILILLIGLAYGMNVFLQNRQDMQATKDVLEISLHHDKPHSVIHKYFKTEAVIGGIGDILIHDWVYEDAQTNDGYDFDPAFEPVHELLQRPDFLIANQESIPGGEEIGISNYPRFNSPYEIVDALMNAGVDMVTNANNHTLDRGEAAILSAISYYEENNLPYTGMFKSPEDKNEIRIMPVNGISLAVLSYATHLNGIPIPQGKDYLVNMLEPEKILADIEVAREKADIVLLALHWGDEYVRYPNEIQKQLADQFIKAGADIIFGHHSHVLQPIEWIEREDGSKGIVIYSLGNFLSGQIRNYKDIGGLVEVKIKKEQNHEGSISTVDSVDFQPTFSSSIQFRNYRVYPLDEARELGFTTETTENIKKFMFTTYE